MKISLFFSCVFLTVACVLLGFGRNAASLIVGCLGLLLALAEALSFNCEAREKQKEMENVLDEDGDYTYPFVKR